MSVIPPHNEPVDVRVRRRLKRNAARCDGCGDTIESEFCHDFRTCSCGALAVDGGLAYARRLFKPEVPFTDLNEYEEVEP